MLCEVLGVHTRRPCFRPAVPLPPCPRKIGRVPSQAAAAHTVVGRTETSLGFIERAQAGPLSAKADGKPPALPPISNRLRTKTIEADLMSRHVPLLRWTRRSRIFGNRPRDSSMLKFDDPNCNLQNTQFGRRGSRGPTVANQES